MTSFNKYLLVFLISLKILFPQIQTNEKVLREFSAKKTLEFKQIRIDVENYAKLNNVPIIQEFSDGSMRKILKIVDGRPIYITTLNLGAAQTTKAHRLWPGGILGLNITGSGYNELGVWEIGGILLSHQEFGARVTYGDATTGTSEHATHVAGTLIASGVDPNAKGMSYNANLIAYNATNDESEMAAAAVSGMEISNHSYGWVQGWDTEPDPVLWHGDIRISSTEDANFGRYSSSSADWDEIAYNAPYYLIVKAAGNDRNDDFIGEHEHFDYDLVDWVLTTDIHDPDGGVAGYDCLLTKSTAKNILTVGAVEELINYSNPSDVSMSSFSGWGPTDDGRIKPDLVAKGVAVYSTSGVDNTSYVSMRGTSMASPNVAGTLVLLQQHYQNTHNSESMRSATLKALAIHSANEAGITDGPDYEFGWGLMNAERAAEIISNDTENNNIINEQILYDGDTYSKIISTEGNEPLKVTICWTDPAGTPVSSNLLNNRTPMLINDLDLKVTNNLNTHYPWSLEPDNPSNGAINNSKNYVDNVEQVIIDNPEPGEYTIEVSHDGILNGGSQTFSIIISGINYEYKTVRIGSQIWMSENLKVTSYRNGAPIPNITSSAQWAGLSTGAYCNYNNTSTNIETYGLLYNWFTTQDSRGLAPIGWHIPTDEEWKQLEMSLGMSQSEADNLHYRGTDEGSKLKSTSGWYINGNGTNESGFTALPGGFRRSDNGVFGAMDYGAYFWSSTEHNSGNAVRRKLNYTNSDVNRYPMGKDHGFSIRCIKDGVAILPNKPVNPSPTNGATNQSRTVDLSWQDGGGASSYDVYFGTNPIPSDNKGNQTSTSYDPGTLVYNEKYFWRIDVVNAAGTTPGDIWDFTVTSEPSYSSIPYSTGFESGSLDDYWLTKNANSFGRVKVTSSNLPHTGSYHLTMDVTTNSNYCLNEAWLHVDLSGKTAVNLNFWWKDFGDETHAEDGIYFSDNSGGSFIKIQDLNGSNYSDGTWTLFNLNVDQLVSSNGLSLNSTFVIKFQQYDNYSITTDGFAFDDISVTGEIVSTPTTPSGPTSGITGTSYSYSTGGSSSNSGHSIQYRFNWGDGNYSTWSSSTSASHSWSSTETKSVKAEARCASHTSVTSSPSETRYVNILDPCISGSIIYNTVTGKFNFCEDGVWVEK